jgi:peptidoglycan/LPS O-acetylase OafA/YrhL
MRPSIVAIGVHEVALLTGLTIAFAKVRSQYLERLGLISYSLHLFHQLVAGWIEGVGFRLVAGTGPELAVMLTATAASVGVAGLMYRVVEVQSQMLSSRISYGTKSEPVLLKEAVRAAVL